MTSGGYRTVTSRATVSRFRKHVSPLTGVVTRLERIDADLPMNTNYFAQHNFSAPAHSIDQLRSGLSGDSFGKGSTAEQGEASALMESIERYSGIFQGDEIRTTRSFGDFAAVDREQLGSRNDADLLGNATVLDGLHTNHSTHHCNGGKTTWSDLPPNDVWLAAAGPIRTASSAMST